MNHRSVAQLQPVPAGRATEVVRFKVLGPLEAWAGRQRLPVGGPKQRAILGYLLVHANEVAATSQIVRTLWPVRAPSTARKMLQNTVSNIRGLLSAHGGENSSTLLTHPPGYVLRIDAGSLDLLHFEQLADAGRAALADGALTRASRSLRASLDLWRGEPLADLCDTGINWSKLSVLRESRLTTLEDYFDAELRLGRHHDHIAELERLLSDEPHRERAACQLMLALYRSGRQVDALEVYRRASAALRDNLGLEPTKNLRDLERAILEHDVGLQPPASGAPIQLKSASPGSAGMARGEPTSGRKLLSILTIALDVREGIAVDAVLAELASHLRDDIDAAGGKVSFYTGSIVQAVFGLLEPVPHEPLAAAVRTAIGVRDRVRHTGGRVEMRSSIRTDDVLITSRGGGVEVVSASLEQCVLTARALPPDEVWVCENTRVRGGLEVTDIVGCGRPAMWWAKVSPRCLHEVDPPFVDRDHELAILDQHLEQATGRGRGRVVMLLGEAGIGKTRLLSEWAGRLRALPNPPVILKTAVPRPGTPWATRTMLAELFACLPGVRDGHGPATVGDLLAAIDGLGPTVLVVEDLHLADDALQECIGGLAAHIGDSPMLAVATARFLMPLQERWQVGAFTVMTLDRIAPELPRQR